MDHNVGPPNVMNYLLNLVKTMVISYKYHKPCGSEIGVMFTNLAISSSGGPTSCTLVSDQPYEEGYDPIHFTTFVSFGRRDAALGLVGGQEPGWYVYLHDTNDHQCFGVVN